MDMESQKILFALSTPMEIRNECGDAANLLI